MISPSPSASAAPRPQPRNLGPRIRALDRLIRQGAERLALARKRLAGWHAIAAQADAMGAPSVADVVARAQDRVKTERTRLRALRHARTLALRQSPATLAALAAPKSLDSVGAIVASSDVGGQPA